MYYEYFGLKQPPFRITPDPSLFFPGGDRGAILDALIYAIVSGEGIVKLVGEVGSGKTTLCRMLEKELPENVEIVYLANPSLSPDNILHAIAFELDLKVKPDDSRLKVMNSLQNYLLERHAENKQIVVFVEEAQSMPIATLEEIRLLSNLETAQDKLLQIVIFGQPELDVMISKPEIRQLKERITYSFYLSPFKPHEVKDYINSRLRACGYRSVELFNDKAINLISKYSNGLLRRINILADKALLASYADSQSTVLVKHVVLAARETEFVDKKHFPYLRWGLISLTATIFIAAAIWLSMHYSSYIINDANLVVQNKPTDKVEMSNSTGDPLILIKEARKNEGKESQGKSIAKLADDASNKPSINDTPSSKEKRITETHDAVIEKIIPRPAPDSLEVAQWQTKDQDIYVYPEKTVNAALAGENKELNHSESDLVEINESGLLEIRDLIRAVSKHGEDDRALLNQLIILPSETAINYKTVASELTCKLCSTIIYRPLKDDKKL